MELEEIAEKISDVVVGELKKVERLESKNSI